MADEQRVVVEPDGVAALDGRGRGHPRGDRDARGLEARADAVRLAEAPLLAGPQERSAAVADEDGVVDVDRVGVAGIVLGDDHLGAGRREQRAQLLVLGRRRGDVGHAAPAVALDVVRIDGRAAAARAPARGRPTSPESRSRT